MSNKSWILGFLLIAIYFVSSQDTPYDQDEYNAATILITPTKPSTIQGTKWCGRDKSARSHDDLGEAVDTDKCCRHWHDCDDFIPPHGEKYEIQNIANFRILHCYCNEVFHQCLKNVTGMEAPIAVKIGIAYFNVISPKCFRKMYYAPTCEVSYYDDLGNRYPTNGGNEYFCPQLSSTRAW